MDFDKKQKIGLALGGGGPRGLAHIGVIKELEKHQIPIDFIAGTSIGAEIGGIYALCKNSRRIESFATGTSWKELFEVFAKPSLFSGGLIDTAGIEKFLEEEFGRARFSDLKLPFRAVAVNINTGNREVLKRGDLINAIIASLSLPLIFKPAKIEGKTLVDGGLADPVPVDVVKKMGADKIIAVNLLHFNPRTKDRPEEPNKTMGKVKVAENTIEILRHHLAHYSAEGADLVLCPDVLRTSWTKFADPEKVIEKGEDVVKNEIKKIKALNTESD